jgi:isocitrate dehydrogenase kinase/phosphatase
LLNAIDVSFWQAHKDRILAGYVFDVFPYDKEKRFGVQSKRELVAKEI